MPFPIAIIVCRFTYIEPSGVGEHWYNTMYLRDIIRHGLAVANRHGLAVAILNSANLAVVGYITILASELGL